MAPNHEAPGLSTREREVAMLAAQGLTDKEIASRLELSPGTLRTYWERARHKLDARSRAHVIAKLLREEYDGNNEGQLDIARLFIINSAEHAVIISDHDGLLGFWSPGIQQVLGYSEIEWVGQHISIIYTPEQREAGVPEQEMQSVRESGPLWQIGWHMKNHGERFWAKGTLFALWDSELKGYGKILRAEDPPPGQG